MSVADGSPASLSVASAEPDSWDLRVKKKKGSGSDSHGDGDGTIGTDAAGGSGGTHPDAPATTNNASSSSGSREYRTGASAPHRGAPAALSSGRDATAGAPARGLGHMAPGGRTQLPGGFHLRDGAAGGFVATGDGDDDDDDDGDVTASSSDLDDDEVVLLDRTPVFRLPGARTLPCVIH